LSVENILEKLRNGQISISEAKKKLTMLMVMNLGNYAKLDINRNVRRQIPEIVFAEGKDPRETSQIAAELAKNNERAIVTRVSRNHVKQLRKLSRTFKVEVHTKAKMVIVKRRDSAVPKSGGKVAVLTAGTADIPVAEETRLILEEMGCMVYTAYDVGVGGLHRLFEPLHEMIRKGVDVFVVVAGMEGALASVVAGLVDCPVIGVPTSIGYGHGGKGEGALMAMLQSCSLGLAVVNVDNGVGAGALASLIANRIAEARRNASA
jgi:NCAIR mutase (PurE)-related protein